jgi:hypothetical protein
MISRIGSSIERWLSNLLHKHWEILLALVLGYIIAKVVTRFAG